MKRRFVLLAASGAFAAVLSLGAQHALAANLPNFTSAPTTVATYGDAYEYDASTTLADGAVTITATTPLPSWLTLTDHGDGTATLTGAPGHGDEGSVDVMLEAVDAFNLTPVDESFTITVSPRPITVTADAQTKNYGDSNPALTYQVTSGSLVNGDTLTGALTVSPSQAVTTHAINRGTLAAPSDYALTFVPGALTINPRPITVTAVFSTKAYDGSASISTSPSLTGGLVNGDTASFSESFADANAGTGKIITPQGHVNDGNAGQNYAVTFVNATGTISQITLSVSGITSSNKSFDGTTTDTLDASGALLDMSNVLAGEMVHLDASNAKGVFANATPGTGKSVTVYGLSLDNGNYAIAPITLSANITTPTSASLATSTNADGTVSATAGSVVAGYTQINGIGISSVLPAGANITGAAGWDGTIAVPTATSNFTAPPATGSGQLTIIADAAEVGSSGIALTFDRGARLVFAGEANDLVGWSRGTTFTPITSQCANDSQATGDALAAGGDCYINVGSDLVVWTKHFTTFVTYTLAAPTNSGTGGGSGGGGGGGGSPASIVLTPIPNTTANTNTTVSAGSVDTAPQTQQGVVLGASTFRFVSYLVQGSSGNAVTQLQNFLRGAGFFKGRATGYFGPITKAGVMQYQKKHGIEQTGTVGSLTRAQLNKDNQ